MMQKTSEKEVEREIDCG
jgi:hypothetical protein